MQYVWLVWSLILMGFWIFVYLIIKDNTIRRKMLIVSLWTLPAGLFEPVFIPEYWDPASLFGGKIFNFDFESLIFSFGVGGLSAISYYVIYKYKPDTKSKKFILPKYLQISFLSLGPISFVLLLFFTEINAIYSTIIVLIGGGFLILLFRPDLWRMMLSSGIIFAIFYLFYFQILVLGVPNYVVQTWNLDALSGFEVLKTPIEELLFAFGSGFLWSGIYEYAFGYRLKRNGK